MPLRAQRSMKQKFLLKSHSYPLQIEHENLLIKKEDRYDTKKQSQNNLSWAPHLLPVDVHQDMISACIIITGADGQETSNASKILYKIFS